MYIFHRSQQNRTVFSYFRATWIYMNEWFFFGHKNTLKKGLIFVSVVCFFILKWDISFSQVPDKVMIVLLLQLKRTQWRRRWWWLVMMMRRTYGWEWWECVGLWVGSSSIFWKCRKSISIGRTWQMKTNHSLKSLFFSFFWKRRERSRENTAEQQIKTVHTGKYLKQINDYNRSEKYLTVD